MDSSGPAPARIEHKQDESIQRNSDFRAEVDGILQKLNQDLWACLNKWQDAQSQIAKRPPWSSAPPKQLPPLRFESQEQRAPSKVVVAPPPGASPQLRATASNEQAVPVQVTDVESPMSQLVPRALDLSLSNSSEKGGQQVANSALSLSSDDSKSETNILRASYFGSLDFSMSQSPSPINTVQSSSKKEKHALSNRPTPSRFASAWSKGQRAEDVEELSLLELPEKLLEPSSMQKNFMQNLESPEKGPGRREKGRLNRLTTASRKKHRCTKEDYSPLAKQKADQLRARQTRTERLVKSQVYELWAAVAILLNALFIVAETEHKSETLLDEPHESSLYMMLVGDAFCVIFLFDLLLRLAADRMQFFRSREWLWNIFDFVVVLTAVLETIIRWYEYATSSRWDAALILGKFSMLRILRLLRVVRKARFIRMSRFFRELRIMVSSLTGAMRTLVWSVVLMASVLLVFGVFFTDGAVAFLLRRHASLQEELSPDEAEVMRFFNSLSGTTLSLYMAMSGGVDWAEIWEALQPLPTEYKVAFLVYLTFAILALLNVVTAVFVETAMQQSQNDRELLVQQDMEQKVEFVDTMQRVFEELDTDGSGTLSLDEFEKKLDDENILNFMSTLELDVDQVRTLLTLLDRDGNGSVDIEEFIEGCLRLKGGAKSLDMAILQYQVEFILSSLSGLRKALDPDDHRVTSACLLRSHSSLQASC
eukprot:TRINITY_DN49880_c0_g1_i1.p1 TRINITY_DN49880_c0_g1~~TRINITY_DN49880_c0_g1_i1.p1  ORF type:complete len:708 (+),score=169.26 TRINITY_DN49880_c0_g1_i1:58-2181(+)